MRLLDPFLDLVFERALLSKGHRDNELGLFTLAVVLDGAELNDIRVTQLFKDLGLKFSLLLHLVLANLQVDILFDVFHDLSVLLLGDEIRITKAALSKKFLILVGGR